MEVSKPSVFELSLEGELRFGVIGVDWAGRDKGGMKTFQEERNHLNEAFTKKILKSTLNIQKRCRTAKDWHDYYVPGIIINA